MEVDKFEEHIKKHLNEREIRPSEGAWDILSAQLPEVAPKKKNPFFWYGVAAAFIGVLLVAALFFKSKRMPIKTEIEVVEAPRELNNDPKKEEVLVSPIKEKDNFAESDKEKLRKEDGPAAIPTKGVIDRETRFVLSEGVSSDGSSQTLDLKTEHLIAAKVAELAVQVELLEGSDLQVTDAEVDSLLRQAQREILSEEIFNEQGKVDAMALLDEVENDLDRTFREQIFESLKTGFHKVRTAVADRND